GLRRHLLQGEVRRVQGSTLQELLHGQRAGLRQCALVLGEVGQGDRRAVVQLVRETSQKSLVFRTEVLGTLREGDREGRGHFGLGRVVWDDDRESLNPLQSACPQ